MDEAEPEAFPPPVNVGRPMGVPKVAGKRPRVSREDVALAMIECGNRKDAAKKLGLKLHELHCKITNDSSLKARFSTRGIRLRKEMDPVNGVSVLDRQANELAVGQASIAEVAIIRLQEIQGRLRLGQDSRIMEAVPAEQRTEDQRSFISKHSLAMDVNGNPTEEKMLMQMEQSLMREYMEIGLAISTISHRRAVTETLLRKLGGGGNRGKPKLGSNPKVARVIVTNSQVVIQQPEATPTIASNGH